MIILCCYGDDYDKDHDNDHGYEHDGDDSSQWPLAQW